MKTERELKAGENYRMRTFAILTFSQMLDLPSEGRWYVPPSVMHRGECLQCFSRKT
jgi:hypothetical protein